MVFKFGLGLLITSEVAEYILASSVTEELLRDHQHT